MKKKYLSIVLLITMLLGAMFALTGCGEKSNDNDVKKYIEEKYPNESFSIISKEKINKIPVRGNGNALHSGYEYKVKSNDTGVEFMVKDVYEYSSYGTGDYILDDNYKRISMISYIEKFKDTRIHIADKDYENNSEYFIVTADIIIEIDDFDSVEEMANTLYKFKNYYENKKPFVQEANISAKVYKSGEYKKSINLSYSNIKINETDLINELSNINK